MNYVARGKPEKSRVRVSWTQCCQPKEKGGLNLINLEDAVVALMTKWIIKAIEPGDSNLHLFLRYKLSHNQPYARGRWSPSLEYFTIGKHQAKRGLLVWNQVSSAWKRMIPFTSYSKPTKWEELMAIAYGSPHRSQP